MPQFMRQQKSSKLIASMINNETNLGYSGIDDPITLKQELTADIEKVKNLNFNALERLNLHFAPTSTFQELSLANNWHNDYLELANSFDLLYKDANDGPCDRRRTKNIKDFGLN